jgi:hypothetical protein
MIIIMVLKIKRLSWIIGWFQSKSLDPRKAEKFLYWGHSREMPRKASSEGQRDSKLALAMRGQCAL